MHNIILTNVPHLILINDAVKCVNCAFMVDINECERLEESPCPKGSYCLDTNGSFVCSCDAGYHYVNRNSQGICIGKFISIIIIIIISLL